MIGVARTPAAVLTTAMAAGSAVADNHGDMKKQGESMAVLGKHMMSGTVTAIDHDTGWLDLETGLAR